MKNRLTDLNNYLFEQLERLNDEEAIKDDAQFEKEMKRTKAIATVGNAIINNAKLALEGKKYADEIGGNKEVPLMLQDKNDK